MSTSPASAVPPPSAEHFTEASAFEGMFDRALAPTGAFADELRAAGYDVKRPELRYPTRVWHACLEVARRHTFPTLPREEGFRRLGHRFMDGYFETLVGKLAAVGLPLFGLEGALKRTPRNWAMSQPQLGIELTKQGERHYTMTLREDGMLPDFCAGLIEASARPTKQAAKVEIVERTPSSCVISVRW